MREELNQNIRIKNTNQKSVSYTHLDVYKRQVLPHDTECMPYGTSAGNSTRDHEYTNRMCYT